MIIDLPNTTTGEINNALVNSRKEGGVVTLGRVMTLVIDATGADAEDAIATANVASREHPCRIIVISPDDAPEARLDAEIRVGGDAGASEVVVLRPSGVQAKHEDTLVTPLLLPDTPIVVWWPAGVPSDTSRTGLGKIAQRRITDSKGEQSPSDTLRDLAACYRPGDTDLAWSRVTNWRALLASALEQVPDQHVTKARIHGDTNSPSILLLGAWLRDRLGCEIEAPMTTRRRASSTSCSRRQAARSASSGPTATTPRSSSQTSPRTPSRFPRARSMSASPRSCG